MGGTAPICPFCQKECAGGQGVKDHIRVKHTDRYQSWIDHGKLPYWQYDKHGRLIDKDLEFLPQ